MNNNLMSIGETENIWSIFLFPLRIKNVTSAWFDENSSTIRNDCSYESQVLYFNFFVTRNIHGDISFLLTIWIWGYSDSLHSIKHPFAQPVNDTLWYNSPGLLDKGNNQLRFGTN